jgi:helix-turn-helix protein/uncharacterized protein DUF4115
VEQGVGKTLREARNRRKIDLPQVEAATKIRIRYLRAIENEEWDVLPGEAYVRAFIRTYAAFLGLDGERLAEEHRREVGATRPAERLPRVEPAALTPKRGMRRRAPRVPPRLAAAIASVILVAILVVVAVSSSGGGGSGGGGHGRGERSIANRRAPAKKPGLSLRLTATAEVWVCLLDGRGEPVVNGQILEAGAEAGPYRSGSFTVALGNGAVRMMVNGRQAEIPESSSPVGYSIAAGGALREIPEGERPSCT